MGKYACGVGGLHVWQKLVIFVEGARTTDEGEVGWSYVCVSVRVVCLRYMVLSGV